MANEITDVFNEVYKDGPAGFPSQPDKYDIRSKVAVTLQQQIDKAREEAQASSQGYKVAGSWAQLTGTPGTIAGQPGRVASTDLGTHTDPVVGGTVPNSGEYRWSGSAWQRTGDVIDPVAIDAWLDPSFHSFSAVARSEIYGERNPPQAGSSLGNNTYVFATPVTKDGYLTEVSGFGINGGGSLKIKVFSASGGNFSLVREKVFTVPSGSFTIGMDAIGAFGVSAGNYVAFYAGSTAKVGLVSDGDTPLFNPAGDVSSFIAGAPVSTLRPQIRLVVGTDVISSEEVDAAAGAVAVMKKGLSAISSRQTIGTSEAPINAATLSNTTYIFTAPIAVDGYLGRIRGFGINGGGLLYIRRYTKSGAAGVVSVSDVFTQVGKTLIVEIPAGAFEIGLDVIGNFSVNAGEYLGVYGGLVPSATAVIGRTAGGYPRTSFARAAAGSGNLSQVTVAAVDATSRVEVALDVERPTVTEARLADVELRALNLKNALATLALDTGVYSPSLALLGRIGCFIDFTDRSTLSQDAAGLIPVKADGEKIGRVRDKSGHGFDFAADNDATRPTWRKNSFFGKASARFNLGNYLRGRRYDLTQNRDKVSVIALAAYRGPSSGNRTIVAHTIESASSSRVFLGANGTRGSSLVRQSDGGASVATFSYKADPLNYNYGDWLVLEAEVDFSGGVSRLYTDGWNTVEGVISLPASGLSPNRPEQNSFIGGVGPSTNMIDADIAMIVEIVGDIEPEEKEAVYEFFSRQMNDREMGDLAPYKPTDPMQAVFFWFNHPSIIRLSGATEKYAVGGVSWGGSIMVGSYAFEGGDLAINQAVLNARLQIDDHDVPSFVQLPDGHVIAVYCRHNVDPQMFLQRTVSAGDLSQWTAPVDIGSQLIVEPGHDVDFSYNFLFRLSSEGGRLYLIARERDWNIATDPATGHTGEYWIISTSDDNGATWARGKRLWGPMRPYTRASSNGVDRIDFYFNRAHPGLSGDNDVFHCYYQGGNFYKSNGTLIGDMSALPLNIDTGPTKVYEVSDGLGNAWVWDLISAPSTGRPVGTFATFRSNYTQIDYYQSRFDGAAWQNHKICDVGGPLIPSQAAYTGGVVTDPDDINTVYCSRQVDANGNVSLTGVYQLFKYVTIDGGATWSGTQLTFGEKPSFRPIIPLGSRKLFYVTGDYGPTYAHIGTHVEWLDMA